MHESRIFFGSEFADPKSFGEFFIDSYNNNNNNNNNNLAMAISVGGKAGCHYHQDLNEDSVAYAVCKTKDQKQYILGVVADAFYGTRAGETMVQTVIKKSRYILKELEVNFTEERLQELMEEIIYPKSVQLKEENEGKHYTKRTKTQLSLIVSNNQEILWFNFGDSRIYSNWENEYEGYQVAPVVYHRSLGYKQQSIESFRQILKVGKVEWKRTFTKTNNPPTIILCSDGFAQSVEPEANPKEIINWAGKFERADQVCENLMNKAFENQACDNLACLVLINNKNT